MHVEDTDLLARRLAAVRAWTAFVEHGDGAQSLVRPEIYSSWERSDASITPNVRHAPLADEADTRAFWTGSPLQIAVSRVEEDLRRTAEDGDLVLAVTDADTRILWTYGGRVMRRKAESVNFVAGGRWDDQSVGTNALDLANRSARPSMVFSAEHYASIVHNWVCWAAPVNDPVTGRQLGVIDLSTTWDRTHPIGLATARVMARLIEQAMPRSHEHPGLPSADEAPDVDGLSLRLLGTAEAHLDGQRLLLNRRQTEILALLAMNPDGVSLERLHALVYGDQGVTLSTLKAEVSHLRAALHGQLTSRPYRLTMPVTTDVDSVLAAVRRGDVAAALAAYGGDLLPGTDSPALTDLGEFVAVAVREALLADPRPEAVVRYSELAPYDAQVIEVCLAHLGDRPHPAKPLLKGRLAVITD
jgi:transcriptional regulator of acetoin/glycerol metabolism